MVVGTQGPFRLQHVSRCPVSTPTARQSLQPRSHTPSLVLHTRRPTRAARHTRLGARARFTLSLTTHAPRLRRPRLGALLAPTSLPRTAAPPTHHACLSLPYSHPPQAARASAYRDSSKSNIQQAVDDGAARATVRMHSVRGAAAKDATRAGRRRSRCRHVPIGPRSVACSLATSLLSSHPLARGAAVSPAPPASRERGGAAVVGHTEPPAPWPPALGPSPHIARPRLLARRLAPKAAKARRGANPCHHLSTPPPAAAPRLPPRPQRTPPPQRMHAAPPEASHLSRRTRHRGSPGICC